MVWLYIYGCVPFIWHFLLLTRGQSIKPIHFLFIISEAQVYQRSLFWARMMNWRIVQDLMQFLKPILQHKFLFEEKTVIYLSVVTKMLKIRVVHQDRSLRKHAYSNILKILQPKKEHFQIRNSDVFHISAQNIDCVCRGDSNEYPQSMFLSGKKKNNVYPCKPQFHCIKVGFKGLRII